MRMDGIRTDTLKLPMTRRDLIALGPLFALNNCSARKEPIMPVTGLRALEGMYRQALDWTEDARVLSCSSMDLCLFLPGSAIAVSDLGVVSCRSTQPAPVKTQRGRAAVWQAVFVSPSFGQQRRYTSSVCDSGATLRKGIFPDAATALTSDAPPFLPEDAHIDSDQAWATALQHAADYDGKHPGTVVSLVLNAGRAAGKPVWDVIWGEGHVPSEFSIRIDADTGQYMQT